MLKVEFKPMTRLSKDVRPIICKCEELCPNYIQIEDYGRFCENDSLDFAYKIINLIKGGVRETNHPKDKKKGRPWMASEQQFVINWYNKGLKYGDRKLIADALNRDVSAVNSRIDYMKKKGLI